MHDAIREAQYTMLYKYIVGKLLAINMWFDIYIYSGANWPIRTYFVTVQIYTLDNSINICDNKFYKFFFAKISSRIDIH